MRFNEVELRANDTENQGIIEGYAILFDIPTQIGDMFNEVIRKGSIDNDTLKDVPLFIAHDTRKIPLARSRNNNPNSTLQLKVDEKGLFFRAELDIENNSESKAVYSAVKREDLQGLSFSFRVQDEKWLNVESEIPTREILKFAQIGEISILANPQYEQTSIYARDEALDSADKLALDNARSQIEVDTSKELELMKLKMKFRV